MAFVPICFEKHDICSEMPDDSQHVLLKSYVSGEISGLLLHM